jgi:hypothetical protein
MPVDSSRSGIFRNLDLAVAISARWPLARR